MALAIALWKTEERDIDQLLFDNINFVVPLRRETETSLDLSEVSPRIF